MPSVDVSPSAITDEVEQQLFDFLRDNHPRLWLAKYFHQSTRKTPLYLHDREWLIPIYLDKSPQMIIQKASQISVTETMLCEMFAQARDGKAVLYVLPTDAIVYGFTPRRIDSVIGRVEYYRKNCKTSYKASDSKKQKTLFGTDCNIVGSNSDLNFYEKPCDVLIIDEHDKCVQDNLLIAWDRLESSTSPQIRIIGNPTLSDRGINKRYFNDSDCKEWFIRCEHCGKAQTLDWFENVVEKTDNGQYKFRHLAAVGGGEYASAVCRHCSKPIDRLSRGEWVAAYPGREWSGYHASSIFGNPRPDTLNRLMVNFLNGLKNPTAMQLFYNNRLGLPYDAEGTKISDKLMRECVDPEYAMPLKSDNPTVCGVDIGNQLHTTISEAVKVDTCYRDRYVFVGSIGSYEELRHICVRYNVACGVMDAGPEIHEPRRFVRETPGAWYLCRYNLNDKVKQGAKANYGNMLVDHRSRSVSVNRTESLDETLSNYISGLMVLPANYAALDNGEFVKQMSMPTRIKEERPDGTFRYIWTKGEDHYRHSDNYRHIAKKIRGGGAMIAEL